MESKSEWMEFYHRNLGLGQASRAPVQPPLSGRVSDAMAVTTTMTMPDLASPQRSAVPTESSAASANSSAAMNASAHLAADGRVAKAPRKRTRVSKRAPTTLLNTDTHNFRAMVQQFTGGPSARLFTGNQGGSNLNVGYGSPHHQMNNPLAAAPLPLAQPSLQQQQEELVFLSSGDSGNVAAAAVVGGSNSGGNQIFLQGFTNSRPNPDSFLFDGVSSNMQPRSATFQRW